MELHRVRATVTIERVNLSIRFPGQLSIQIKHTNEMVKDLDQLYSLKDGECLINETALVDFNASYDSVANTYEETTLHVLVSVITSSGKISAGTVSFNATAELKTTLPLKRCSDKNASISLSSHFQKLQKLHDIETSVVSAYPNSDSPILNLKQESLTRLRMPHLISRQERIQRNQLSSSKNSSESKFQGLASSKIKRDHMDNRLREIEQSHTRKITILNQEKKELEKQLDQAKDKIRIAERKEKQLDNMYKEQRQTAEKRKSKITQLQYRNQDVQRSQAEQDRKIRVLQAELKDSKEKYEEVFSRLTLAEKKQQSRDHMSLEREKKLIEKQQNAQRQHQKILSEHNKLLEKMEIQERNNIAATKIREKSYIQERSKFKEQIASLEDELSKIKQTLEDQKMKVETLNNSEKSLKVKMAQVTNQVQLEKNGNDILKIQSNRLLKTNEELQRQIEEMNSIEGEKSTLKRKVNELSQEKLKLQQKVDKLHLEVEDLKERLKQRESLNDELKSERKELLTKLNQSQKAKMTLQRQVARLQSEVNSLGSEKTFLNERFNDLKTKTEQDQRFLEDEQETMLNKINSLMQSKEYLEADLEDYKWNLENQKNSTQQVEKQLRQKNAEILALQGSIMELQKDKQEFKLQIVELQITRDTGRKEKSELLVREKQLQHQLTLKEDELYESQKQVALLQQTNFMLTNKVQTTIQSSSDNVQNLESQLSSARRQLEQNHLKLKQTETSLISEQDKRVTAEKELKRVQINLEDSQKALRKQEERFFEQKSLKDSLQKTLDDLQEQHGTTVVQSDALILQFRQEKERLQKQVSQQQREMEANRDSMREFLQLAAGDQEASLEEITAFTDQVLAKLQLQSLKHRNKYLQKHRDELSQLNTEITYLEGQVALKSRQIQDKTEQIQQQNSGYSNQLKDEQRKHQEERQKLKRSIEDKDTQIQHLTSDKQRLEAKHSSLSELYEEQKNALETLISQHEEAKEEIRKLQNNVLDLKSKQISKKGQEDALIHNLKVELTQQVEQEKERLAQKVAHNKQLEKKVSEMDKTIVELRQDLDSLQVQKDKLETELEESREAASGVSEDKSRVEAKVQQLQRRVKERMLEVDAANQKANASKKLNDELSRKIKGLHDNLSEQMVAKQKVQNELQSLREASVSASEEHKSKIAQLEDSLQAEQRKNQELVQKNTEQGGAISIKEFEVKQLEDKIVVFEGNLANHKREIEDKRNALLEAARELEETKRSLFSVEKDRSEFSHEKDATIQELNLQKERAISLQLDLEKLRKEKESAQNRLHYSEGSEASLRSQKQHLSQSVNELKESLGEAKRDIQKGQLRESELTSKLNMLAQQLKEKIEFYEANKSKNWEESQREKNSLKDRVKELGSQLSETEEVRQAEAEELNAELDELQQQRDELLQALDEKDQEINRQEQELIEAQNRIIALNAELRSCLQAWEKQKLAALPSRRQVSKIEADIAKFQSYASELDRTTNQLLTSSPGRTREEYTATTSKKMVELVQIINRSESLSLSQTADDSKGDIAREYERMREKVQEVIQHSGSDSV